MSVVVNGQVGLIQRFLSKVLMQDDGCHEWQSTLHRDGYGKFWLDGQQVQAHRMAYLIHHGDIPVGAWVLHHCDNRKCVNPEHLYLGNAKQNSQDRTQRLRYQCYKLSTEAVSQIRNSYSTGCWSQQELADLHGVNQAYISRVIRGMQRILK